MSIPTTTDIATFVEKVMNLKENKGRWADLKRNAGNTLAEARKVSWFYGLLDNDGYKHPNIYFLVATLITLNPKTINGNFGKTMRILTNIPGTNPGAIEKRFTVLLDADFESHAGGELAFRLRQLVKLTASKEVGVDWSQLLSDLLQWRYENKPVQQRWAKEFFAPELQDIPTETASETATNETINDEKELNHVS